MIRQAGWRERVPSGRCGRFGQRGATLLIAMILLTLTALAVASAYSLSVSNLLVVGNVQRSEEAQAAGLRAMEVSVSSQIKALPPLVSTAQAPTWPVVDTRNEDVDGDGQNDFEVSVATFRCIESVLLTEAYQAGTATSVQLGAGFNPFIAYDTLWEFEGAVRDLRNSGARLTVAVGVRIQLTQVQLEAYCATPP